MDDTGSDNVMREMWTHGEVMYRIGCERGMYRAVQFLLDTPGGKDAARKLMDAVPQLVEAVQDIRVPRENI